MKIKFILLLSLAYGFNYAQSLEEQVKILKSYENVDSKAFLSQLNDEEKTRELRVNQFVLRNNLSYSDVEFSKNGVRYKMFDVIEDKPIFLTTDNASAARAIKVNHLYSGGSLGLSLSGQGMAIGVWDGGWVLGTHNEFVTGGVSKVSHPDAGVPSPVTDFHGTHVAGTAVAKGANPSAKGMAPNASVRSYNWTNDVSEVTSDILTNALLISNHSYGVPVNEDIPNWYMGCYSDVAASWDQLAFNYQYYLSVMSAGNSGGTSYSGGLSPAYDKLTGNKNSKNALIVANANPTINPLTGNLTSLVINSSSSQGPTDDGRIKPDVAADGTNLFSSSNANTSAYDTTSGTSMASPSAAGSLLLLQEHFFNLNSQYMRAATLKSLVSHTALDDSNSVGPDPIFGFGFLDIRESAQVLSNSNAAIPTAIVNELILDQGQTYTIQVTVNAPKKLKATIGWTDPAGPVMNEQLNSPTPVLVNDLDLRIIKDAEVNFPWKLQLSDVTAPAIKGDNIVDNIEKVEVENALGTYTIQVSHKGSLTGSNQAYSLIVSGFDEIVLSNSSVVKNEFFVYPNPANDFLNIESPNAFINKYEIYDMQGRLVANASATEVNSLQVNLQSYNSGVYIIKLFSENGTTIKKFTKK